MLFMEKTAALIGNCNEETVHVPLEGLAFLSKVGYLTFNHDCYSWIQHVAGRFAHKLCLELYSYMDSIILMG
jgi:hypothetical protein